jgi:Zn-dependent M28 family amino/carboxypeptidase
MLHRLAFLCCALCALPATAGPLSAADEKAAGTITPEQLRGHIRFLGSDLLEGRGPATPGDRLAQAYIQSQMETLGLRPGAPGGGWLQKFDIVGIDAQVPRSITFQRGGQKLELKINDDFVAVSGVQAKEARVDNAEVVFVGYGIVAPEYQWDDFKGVDLKGKVLLMMNNDPDHSALGDPKLFEGRRRLYYGRWDYKFAMAAQQGAVAAILIHTDASAGYKWQVPVNGSTGEQFELPHEGEPRTQVTSWASEDASRRLARLGGFDLDALRAAAEKRDFKPVPLGVRVSLTLRNQISRKQTANVIGVLPGADAARSREAVFYTAHHDHMGVNAQAKPGEDRIYNGALDNASGVAAMLAIARAHVARGPRARAIYFAAVAAEEQGLLGSKFLCAHPPVAPGRIAADINMDGVNIWGRTRDYTQIGAGKSSLDRWVQQLAAVQDRRIEPDQFPEKGVYYRSDQFSFARIGVPGAYFHAGTEVIGKPEGWGRAQQQDYEDRHYHQPSDELRDDWDFSGAIEDTRLLFWLGLKIADDDRMPQWMPGDEFEATRKKAIADLAAP